MFKDKLMTISIQNALLTIIAICLILITFKFYIADAHADDSHIISRILYCIDGSSISGGTLTTFCDR